MDAATKDTHRGHSLIAQLFKKVQKRLEQVKAL